MSKTPTRREPSGLAAERREQDATTWQRRLLAAQSDQNDPRSALQAACDVVRELLPCDRVQVWRGDLRQLTVSTIALSGYSDDEARRLRDIVAPMQTGALIDPEFVSRKITFVRDALADQGEFTDVAFRPFGITSVAILLLHRGERIIGALQLSWLDPERAYEPSPEIAETIRQHLSLAVDFVARTDEAVQLSETLSETAILLGSIHDPEELLVTTAGKLAEAIGCDWCAIHLLEEGGATLFRAAHHGLPEVFASLDRLPLDPSVLSGAMGSLQDGVVEVPDTGIEHEFAPELARRDIASFFGVPLVQDGVLIGFLTLGYRRRKGRFSRRQISLAKGLAHHVLAALRNARTMRSLRDVNQVKSDFIAAVSHDLRTPLHVVIGYADMLADGAAGALNPEQDELVDRLREGALRFRERINDVLDVARLDAGHDVIAAAPVVLSEICAELRDELDILRKPAVELRCDVGDLAVITDGAKVRTILRNLLSNALKFTRSGSVEAIARYDGKELLLRVRDTGPGIGEDDRPRIFEMFQQGDAGRRAGGSGLGLGLYLVRRLADLLGGRVELASAEPGDTAFEVRLPVKSVPRRPDAQP